MPAPAVATGLPARSLGARLDSPVRLLGQFAVWLPATIVLRPLPLSDEGRHAGVARAMLLGGAWVPTLNGLPLFHKLPLFYWLDAAALQLFGVNAVAARIAAVLGAWLLGAALLLGMERRAGRRTTAIAPGVLTTCQFFCMGSQGANHTMLVASLITVAVFTLVRAVDEPAQVKPGWLEAGAVASALALLASGPIGLVLPALTLRWSGWLPLALRRASSARDAPTGLYV